MWPKRLPSPVSADVAALVVVDAFDLIEIDVRRLAVGVGGEVVAGVESC